MYIGQIVTLSDLIEEIISWFEITKQKQEEQGIWKDVIGYFCKIQFTKYNKLLKIKNKWTLLNSGVYSAKQHFYTKQSTQNQYTFIFKGTDWNPEELEKEVTRQYKNFIVKAKLVDIKNDFGE